MLYLFNNKNITTFVMDEKHCPSSEAWTENTESRALGRIFAHKNINKRMGNNDTLILFA
jgi:hypothetical protein